MTILINDFSTRYPIVNRLHDEGYQWTTVATALGDMRGVPFWHVTGNDVDHVTPDEFDELRDRCRHLDGIIRRQGFHEFHHLGILADDINIRQHIESMVWTDHERVDYEYQLSESDQKRANAIQRFAARIGVSRSLPSK